MVLIYCNLLLGGTDDDAQPKPTANPFTDSGGLTICSMIGRGHRPQEAFFEDKGIDLSMCSQP